MINKLENPKRIEELNPLETLKQIGFCDGQAFCDIGAGTGIFAFAATSISSKDIYAVDISESMREILHTKNQYKNIKIEVDIRNVPNQSCNVALLCTVLHELDNISDMATEIKRILTDDGVLAIIEFHKKETTMGPPVERRISEVETVKILTRENFKQISQFTLGDNFYCIVFGNVG